MVAKSAFLSDESGAVTVDWVVLTAAIVGLGLLAATTGIFDMRSMVLGGAGAIGDGATRASTVALED